MILGCPIVRHPGDPLDMLFSSSSTGNDGLGGQQVSEVDDWGLDSEFGGGNEFVGGTTTELEWLPPPPAGVTFPMAKNKGMDNYKQGQFAEAIKWLSWAAVLLERGGDKAITAEVLLSRASCYKEVGEYKKAVADCTKVLLSRASCYKEVGEYKKAVADCTKVLEQDSANVGVLVRRALLYESIEKYKLGSEDLRSVQLYCSLLFVLFISRKSLPKRSMTTCMS